MKKILPLIFLLLCMNLIGAAQTDSIKSPIKFSGHIETYYSFDMSNPTNHLPIDYLEPQHSHYAKHVNRLKSKIKTSSEVGQN